MATKVLVPLLGEGVEEVTVIKWLKNEGDTIDELEPLLEVNTDKVDTEIPAPVSGTVLKILAELVKLYPEMRRRHAPDERIANETTAPRHG